MSEEVVDPHVILNEKALNDPAVKVFKQVLDECTKRVNSTPGTHENCQEELNDFLKVRDAVVAPKLFAKLK